jgi:hypothetical protein
MRRSELEHIIRAAAAITNQYEIMVIGSQSILGSVAEPPAALVESMEADIYPVQRPELAELIEGAIGEGSPFHDQFGYYAQGVGPETAILPTGWQNRLARIQNPNTDLKVGYCLDPHDLAISKLAAGREKDWPFVAEMIRHGFVEVDKLIALAAITPLINRIKLSAWLQAQRRA